ncbi:hypothetical protein [Microcoleus sp. Pol10D4]|uniref:hypothetical protein n=1 Tax=Microcoleus sp. Pol10D4 TaxID=3055387 RepID=UPI002FD50B6C
MPQPYSYELRQKVIQAKASLMLPCAFKNSTFKGLSANVTLTAFLWLPPGKRLLRDFGFTAI